MTELSVIFQQITFAYARSSQVLIRDLSVHFPRGWSGIVGANGVGKSTILKLATGNLDPQRGTSTIPGSAIYCPQRTDHIPDHLLELLQAMDGDAFRIKGQLGVAADWPERWPTLSHGERKRAQLAVALWRRPRVLAVDEPTNHLDTHARELVFRALVRFKGVGLLVSHDRQLLDDLCAQCLFVDPPGAVLRPGNYSRGYQQTQLDEVAARKRRDLAKQDLLKLKRESASRRRAACRANQKRFKRGLAQKDHDAKSKIDLARLSGKDGSAGRRLNQLKGRMSQAQAKLDRLKVKKTYQMGIWMPGAISKRDTLFTMPAGSLRLGATRLLDHPDLAMRPTDRIALCGANGSGKSTLVNHIIRSLTLAGDQVVYLPQEIDARMSRKILEAAKTLPHDVLGRMMTVVSCLGSRPRRLLESQRPSPGETRKILLATGIAKAPHLIVMDEPTNHLDLPSIQCLEEALAHCPCCLLLVSHDQRFLKALTRIRWQISPHRRTNGKYILELV